MVIRKVEAPAPSRWHTAANRTVPTATATMFPLVSRTVSVISGLNRPTSFMIPKKMMAKISITATSITELSPVSKKSLISPGVNPAISAPTIGMRVRPTTGEIRPRISSVVIQAMTASPMRLSILPPEVTGLPVVRATSTLGLP